MELNALIREKTGKSEVRKLREEGVTPGVLYGHRIASVSLSVNEKELMKVFSEAGESTVIDLNIAGDKRPVLIYGIDVDPISRKPLAADFYQVKMDEKVSANVPLSFIGESPAVKDLGGILVTVIDEIELEALPKDLPHNIEVDISGLTEIGNSIHVKDLKFPKGVEHDLEPEAAVVLVSEQREEEEQDSSPTSVEDVVKEGDEKKGEVKTSEADSKK